MLLSLVSQSVMSAHFGVRILKIALALTMDVTNSTKIHEL